MKLKKGLFKIRIIIDMDSTITDTHVAVLDLYREITGDYSTEVNDETVEWNMRNVCPQWSVEQVNDVFSNPRFFELLKPFNHSIDVLKKLKDDGHELVLCTVHKPEGIPFKQNFINEHLLFFDEIVIIPSEYVAHGKFDKSSVKGDIIIDDRIDNLESSPAKWKVCYGNYTWNQNWEDLRVCNWINLYSLINEIELAERTLGNE